MVTPSKSFGLILLPVIIIIALILGPIIRNGMFLDGLVYTNIARNLASDIGYFWAPQVFRNGEVFHEHPVFLPYVASYFFRLFGDGLFVEDLFNLTILAGTILFLYRIWIFIVGRELSYTFFLPLLLWSLNQEVQLRYPNTMLECGTTLILLAATYAYLKLNRRTILAASVVGIGVFLAVLSKGPFGLFLLALPSLYQFIIRNRFSWAAMVTPAVICLGCFLLLFFTEPSSLTFFKEYINQQVIASIEGRRVENIATTRFDFLYWLFVLNLPALALSALLAFFKTETLNEHRKPAILLLALGATAILPLAISIKQAAYYQLVALPFFILSLSLSLLPNLLKLVRYLNHQKIVRLILNCIGIIGVVVASGVAISMCGTTDRRDQGVIKLTNEIANVFENQGEINYELKFLGNESEAAARSYRLTNFLNRYHNIHLDQTTTPQLILYLQAGKSERPPGQLLFEQNGIIIVKREN